MIHQQLKKAIDKLALRSSILPKSNLGKAIRYAINQSTNLETYLGDGRVEIWNNLVEKCRRLGINPKEYLTDVLTRLPAIFASEAVISPVNGW